MLQGQCLVHEEGKQILKDVFCGVKTAFEKVGYGLMCENRLLVTPHTTLLRVLLEDGAQTVELQLLGP